MGHYMRDRAILVLLWVSCLAGHEGRSSSQADMINKLREKIMHSWSEVNIARAISPHDVDAFYHRIIKAHLELYGALCAFSAKGNVAVPDELLPICRIMKGLCLSHDAWCAEQKRTITIGAYYLMLAITQIWSFATKGSLPDSVEQSVDLLEREEHSEFCYAAPQGRIENISASDSFIIGNADAGGVRIAIGS